MNLLQMSCMIIWAQKKSASNLKKRKKVVFSKKKNQIGIFNSKLFIWEKKFSCLPQKCKLELCMSNSLKVMIYLSLYLSASISRIVDSNPQGLNSSWTINKKRMYILVVLWIIWYDSFQFGDIRKVLWFVHFHLVVF